MGLQWNDSWKLDLPEMDDTHEEFVRMLGTASDAPDVQLLALWQDLLAHTEDHFGREDRWMAQTRFSSGNCHSLQHKVVLQVMREGLEQGQQGQLTQLRQMVHELGAWFAQHAQSMDAALALHLRRVGYEPQSGQVLMPEALPLQAIEGCGSHACSGDHPAPVEAEAT